MICVTGNSSNLKCNLFPPLDLGTNENWEMGFLDLMTYHSIPNVEEGKNDTIQFDKNLEIKLSTGSYEIDHINEAINHELREKNSSITFELKANTNTLKSMLKCSSVVDFSKPDSLGSLLGFIDKKRLEADVWHTSSHQVSINKVDVIRITCNIVSGSYRDGVEGHVLHEFYPAVPPGFKILEKPNTINYLPINRKQLLDEFNIRLEDQDGNLVNFREELINLRVEIRKRR